MKARRPFRFVVALLFAGLLPPAISITHGAPPTPRPPSTVVRIALELNGAVVGFVKSVSGGSVIGEVVSNTPAPGQLPQKHVASVTYEPFAVEVDFSMAKVFYDWIRTSLENQEIEKDGAVIFVDGTNKEVFRKDFVRAMITEVTFPTLDGASKEPGYMTIKFNPGTIRYKPGSGTAITLPKPPPTSRKWIASNFRLEVGQLPTQRVARIDGFTWKRIAHGDVGTDPRRPHPVMEVNVPNLTLAASYTDFKPWYDWFRASVIDGKDVEQSGILTFLAADQTKELATVTLGNVGIFALDLDQTLPRFDARLYVEVMNFNIKGL